MVERSIAVWITSIGLMFLLGIVPVSANQTDIKPAAIVALDWSPDGSQIAIGKSNGVVEILDADTGRAVENYGPLDRGINGVAWNPVDANRIPVVGGIGIVTILDLSTDPITSLFTPAVKDIADADWSPDGTQLAGVVQGAWPDEHPQIIIWDGKTAQENLVLEPETDVLTCVQWSSGGAFLAAGSIDGKIVIWDMATHSQRSQFEMPDHRIDAITWRSDGSQIAAAASYDYPIQSSIAIWDISSGDLLANYPKAYVPDLVWAKDPNQIIIVNDDTVEFLDVQNGDVTNTFESSRLNVLALNPNEYKLAYGGSAGLLQIETLTNTRQ